tara:strand:- start:418 stop:849 length:432 start_codon:yes stop_codon:yes gene_type:complete
MAGRQAVFVEKVPVSPGAPLGPARGNCDIQKRQTAAEIMESPKSFHGYETQLMKYMVGQSGGPFRFWEVSDYMTARNAIILVAVLALCYGAITMARKTPAAVPDFFVASPVPAAVAPLTPAAALNNMISAGTGGTSVVNSMFY